MPRPSSPPQRTQRTQRPPRDAAATQARLVDAAIAEFAAHGLAGGRVDRIAIAARANKRAIYDYFGSKEGLFDVAVRQTAEHLTASVPLDERDLPAYAAALFDYLLEHPEAQRLIAWRRLERPDSNLDLSRTFVAQLSGGADGADELIGSVDRAILVIALANAWDLSGPDVAGAAGLALDDPQRIARHRRAVVEGARRIATP